MIVDLGLLILRLALGAVLFGHGAQKLLGWFGGPGFAGTTGMFGSHLRLRPAPFWALVGSLTEVVGGLLLAAGLLAPFGSIAIVAAMLMALTVHWPRFWATEGGIEYPLVLLVAALAVGLTGPGVYSLDSVLGIQFPEPFTLLVGLLLALVGVGIALGTRAPSPVATEERVAAAS
jgi:putative oxidoreductase